METIDLPAALPVIAVAAILAILIVIAIVWFRRR